MSDKENEDINMPSDDEEPSSQRVENPDLVNGDAELARAFANQKKSSEEFTRLVEKRMKNAELREKYQEICIRLAEKQENTLLAQDDAYAKDPILDSIGEMLKEGDKDMGIRELAAQADFLQKSAEYLLLKSSQFSATESGEVFYPAKFAATVKSLIKNGYNEWKRPHEALKKINTSNGVNKLLSYPDRAISEIEEKAFEDNGTSFGKHELSGCQLAWFGRIYASYLNDAPEFDLLRPALDDNRFPLPVKPKKVPVKTNNEKAKDVVILKKRLSIEDEELAGVSKELDVVIQSLKSAYKIYNDVVPYYHFVIDPKDFGKTVENMFYVSFLLRDARIQIQPDDNGLPVIMPMSEKDRGNILDKGCAWPNRQNIRELSHAQWERMKDVLGIEKAMIDEEAMAAAISFTQMPRSSARDSSRKQARP